jgi:steroid delta-isomerase-like uncharacterized protein
MFRKAWILVIVLLLVTGVTASTMAQEATCDEAQIRTDIQRVIDEAFNQGNMAVVDELFAEDYISHPDEIDREGFKAQVTALRTAMPNGQSHIEHLLVEGCDVFFAFHLSGVMEGELGAPGQAAIPPTGRDLHFDSHVYLRLNEQGQTVEEWDYFDNFGFLTQVGVIPSPEGAAVEMEATEEAVSEEAITVSGNEATNIEIVRRAYEEGFNAGDFDLLRQLYAPDFIGNEPGSTTANLEELISSMTALRNAFPDATLTINDSVAEGNEVATRVTLTGTFQNDLTFEGQPPIPATGQPLTLEMSFLHRVDENGLIAEDWELFDQLSFLTQLGVLQPPPAATEQSG